ncbi:MAG TPA: DUF362 domain-containing protein [Bacteroidales bacterium]|nr:DUF362 domain-containing protein [Bacteroidales bacterium]
MPVNRRQFIGRSVLGAAALATMRPFSAFATFATPETCAASVGLTTGVNRADMAFRALSPFASYIKKAVAGKRIILKPNNVSIDIPLCATHADTLEGILEFFKSIGRTENIIIAESAANGPTFDGFSNYGYFSLAKKYNVKFMDLDREGSEVLYLFDERDFRPHPARFSKVLLDNTSFIVSAARMKTHDRVIATLSLKNIVVGAPVKDDGFRFDSKSRKGAISDKSIVHGGGFKGINYNLYVTAPKLHPHLAVIDGFEGMEGNGPNSGTPVDHRVCVASTDWLAADRVAVELMGIDYTQVAWLNYCMQTGQGVGDLDKIGIIGEKITDHIIKYKLSDNIGQQLILNKS